MSRYAIGDIQGCFDALQRLLARLDLGASDRLWLVGDLVNRGPRSLEVLRWAAAQPPGRLRCVLGNHDLYLLARWAGIAPPLAGDTLEQLLEAPDAGELCEWLRCRPLLHREGSTVMVHAGFLPGWSVDEAAELAAAAEEILSGDGWKSALAGWFEGAADDFTTTLDALTRLRCCSADGGMDLDFTGPPEEAPAGFAPWFELRAPDSEEELVVFGHWASLGLDLGPNRIALDSGCVWGGELTAVRLEDRAVFSEGCAEV